MTLARAQRLFWRAVRERRAPAELDELFVSRAPLSAKRRMQIYRAAYWSRHERALQESYPRLFERMGGSAFRELVAGYIERYPSDAPAIERAGARLAQYLEQHGALGDQRLALRDLARLEWARVHALLADDPRGSLDPRALAALDAPHRALRMASSLSLAGQRAIWRGPRGVAEAALASDEARALERALRGETLSAVCAELDEPEAAVRARAMLERWLRRRWITALEVP